MRMLKSFLFFILFLISMESFARISIPSSDLRILELINEKAKEYVPVKVIEKKDSCKMIDVINSINRNLNIDYSSSFFKDKKYYREIKIAVIDTGIDFSVPAFSDKIFVPDRIKKDGIVNYGYDSILMNTQPADNSGHGTNIAGIIASINARAKIFPIRYYDQELLTNSDNLSQYYFKKSLEMAINSNVDIINLSGGGFEFDKEEFDLIKEAEKKGILIVAASGNSEDYKAFDMDEKKKIYYPAGYGTDNIIAVMSTDRNFNLSKFSNFGEKMDLSITGENILSYGISKNCKSILSGTSQATAIMSGYISLLLSRNKTNPMKIKKTVVPLFVENNEKINNPKKYKNFNIEKFSEYIKNLK